MGKKVLSKPIGDLLTKSTDITQAFQRVFTHKTFEGIFLSNRQLIKLSNKLKSEDADGAFFMIGLEGGERSVEVIPFKLSTKNEPQFYFKDSVRGKINIALGRPFPTEVDGTDEIDDSDEIIDTDYGKLIIDGNGLRSELVGASMLHRVKKGTSQKTPPPNL